MLKLLPSLLGWGLTIDAKLLVLVLFGGLTLAFSLGFNKVFVEGDLA